MALRIQDIGTDPELASFLPPLTPDEKAALAADIDANGYTDPIIVWLNHAVIVDGHNRFDDWKARGSDPDNAPDIIERRFADKAEVMLWMANRQSSRRNWTAAQRAAVYLQLKPQLQAKAKAAQQAAGGDRKSATAVQESAKQAEKSLGTRSAQAIREPKVNEQIAAAAKVSPDTVRKVETVLAEGSAETKDAMLAGTKSANAAYTETKNRLSGSNSQGATSSPAASPPGRPPKNGQPTQPTFNEKKIDDAYGVLLRSIDARNRVFPARKAAYESIRAVMGDLHSKLKAWRK